ncbi:MAG: hypothetical protein V1735_06275 [Nanoarchaeota archaeon]
MSGKRWLLSALAIPTALNSALAAQPDSANAWPVPPYANEESVSPMTVKNLSRNYLGGAASMDHLMSNVLEYLSWDEQFRERLTGDTLRVCLARGLDEDYDDHGTLDAVARNLIDMTFDVNRGISLRFREKATIPLELPSVLLLKVDISPVYRATVLERLDLHSYPCGPKENAIATRIDEGCIKVRPGNIPSWAFFGAGSLFCSQLDLPPLDRADYAIILGREYSQVFAAKDSTVQPLGDIRNELNEKVAISELDPGMRAVYFQLLQVIEKDSKTRLDARKH